MLVLMVAWLLTTARVAAAFTAIAGSGNRMAVENLDDLMAAAGIEEPDSSNYVRWMQQDGVHFENFADDLRDVTVADLDEMSIGEEADQAAILRVTAQIPAAVAASRASAPAASAGSTVNTLGDFLDAAGLGSYADMLTAEGMEIVDVASATDEDLSEMGMSKAADRARFIKAAAKLLPKQKAAPAGSSSNTEPEPAPAKQMNFEGPADDNPDTNGDGALDQEEFRNFKDLWGDGGWDEAELTKTIKNIYDKYDTDGNGKLETKEFLKFDDEMTEEQGDAEAAKKKRAADKAEEKKRKKQEKKHKNAERAAKRAAAKDDKAASPSPPAPTQSCPTGWEITGVDEWVQGKTKIDSGALTILFFMSQSCHICHEVAPALDALHRKLRHRGLQVVAVHATPKGYKAKDEDVAALKAWVKDKKLSFHIADSHSKDGKQPELPTGEPDYTAAEATAVNRDSLWKRLAEEEPYGVPVLYVLRSCDVIAKTGGYQILELEASLQEHWDALLWPDNGGGGGNDDDDDLSVSDDNDDDDEGEGDGDASSTSAAGSGGGNPDLNGDGGLNAEELVKYLKMDAAAVGQIMAQYDADKDDKMSPTEFQKFVSWHFPHPVSLQLCTCVQLYQCVIPAFNLRNKN